MDQPKRLYRSTTNRILGGVAGGLGEYFSVDPTLIRVAFVVLSLGGGFGILAYLVLWLVIPERGHEQQPIEQRVGAAAEEMKQRAENVAQTVGTQPRTSGRFLVGLILVGVGLMALTNSLLPWHWVRWDVFWAVVIVAIGFSIITKRT